MPTNRFTFFESYGRIIQKLNDQDVAKLMRAIVSYAFDGEIPELSGKVELIWLAIKPNIDSSIKSITAGSKRNTPRTENEAPIEAPEEAPSEGADVGGSETNRNRNRSRNRNRKRKDTSEAPLEGPSDVCSLATSENLNLQVVSETSPPTPTEVDAYLDSQGAHPIDSDAFVKWYSDHGWSNNGWHGSAMTWSTDDLNQELAAHLTGRARTLDDMKEYAI